MKILGGILLFVFAISAVAGLGMWILGWIMDYRSRSLKDPATNSGGNWNPSLVKTFGYSRAHRAAWLIRWGFILFVGSFAGIIVAAQLFKAG